MIPVTRFVTEILFFWIHSSPIETVPDRSTTVPDSNTLGSVPSLFLKNQIAISAVKRSSSLAQPERPLENQRTDGENV